MTIVYDLVVIGGGPGGFAAAMRAAQLGGRVALIEERDLGGNCMHHACIPVQALMAAARTADMVRRAETLGVRAGEPAVDMEAVHAHKDQVIEGLRLGTAELLSNHGVSLFRGRGRMAGPEVVQVGEQQLQARNVVIATGSAAAQLPVEGADLPGVIGTEEVVALRRIPPRTTVLASSPQHLELAQYLNLMGSQVTLIVDGPRLLPEADHEIAQRLGKLLHDAGIDIRRRAVVEAIRRQADGSLAVVLGAGQGPIGADTVLAARRLPNTAGLGLRELSVRMDGAAIVVDEHMRTSIPHLYAVGDAAAGAMWSHQASAEGAAAAENALGLETRMDYHALPRCLFTWPEVAWVGLSEEQAAAQGLEVAVGRAPMAINPYAILHGQTAGMAKVVVEPRYGKILGVHMMLPGAVDLIAAPAVAMLAQATVRELQRLVPPHPSLGEALVDAALDVERRSLHLPRLS